MTAVRRAFRALEVRDYRALAFAQLVSIVGTMVQGVGQAWLVLRLDGGGVDLGVVAAAQFLPLLVVGPLGGVIVDRLDRRRLLLRTQLGMGAVAAVLALLAATSALSIAGVAALALVSGILGAIDGPARGALAADVVGRERIANAVALHEVWINSARIVGPVLGGVLVSTAGPWACFAVNAISFVPVLFVVRSLAPSPGMDSTAVTHGEHLVAGLRYAWRHRGVRHLLLLGAAIGTFFNFGVVLPLLARDTFGGGPESLGTMIAAIGAGALAGSLILAAADDPTPRRLERLGLAAAACLVASAAAPSYGVALVVLAAAGATGVCLVAVASALLQLHSSPAVRGRLLALWSVALVGTTAITGPTAGVVTATLGPRFALAAIGLAVAVAVLAPRRSLQATLTPKECSMPSLDRRTKRRSDVRPAAIDAVADHVRDSDAARRAQAVLALPPLSLVVGADACTIHDGHVAPGVGDGVVLELSPDALTDLVAGVRSTQALGFASDATLRRGSAAELVAWEHVLRALFDGRPLHEPGSIELCDRDGSPLDLRRAFTPEDDDADIAHFLAEAGFLHLRGWIDPLVVASIEAEVVAAAASSERDQPHRWWATLADGQERCVRVMYVLEVSPTMATLVESQPYLRLGALYDDGHRRFPERPQSSEALVKPVGVVAGVADLPLHRDCSFGGCDYQCAGYAVGLPLTRTGVDDGYLHLVAGSHRASIPPPGLLPGVDSDLPLISVHTEPGDLTVHVGCILHGTRPPRTRDRSVVYTTFSLAELTGEEPRVDFAVPDLSKVRAVT